VSDSLEVEVGLYGRLFTDANAGGKDFMVLLNPASLETIRAYVEPGMVNVEPDTRLQFERHGYFVADSVDSVKGVPVFNRVTTLKDSWGK
jgi:glutaminyl-tRNA synthetase